MTYRVMLDTSFLISLADARRPHHMTAEKFLRYFMENQIPVLFSTIVASEFGVMQSVMDLPLHMFEILPFNMPHACKAAGLDFNSKRDAADARNVVKDDFKLLAQADEEQVTHILTEDVRTLARYCGRLRDEGKITVTAITLVDGFDVSHFEGGQKSLAMDITSG